MGTKNNPGKFDCYANAEPDEPMFVLLGRDPTAAVVVAVWRVLKTDMRENGKSTISDEKLAEAHACEQALTDWALAHGKDPSEAREAFVRVFNGLLPRR